MPRQRDGGHDWTVQGFMTSTALVLGDAIYGFHSYGRCAA